MGVHSPLPAPQPVEENHRTKGLLRLTMACNERCPFCNVPVEDYPRPTPPESEIEAELQAFVASGARILTISGGEPTLLRARLVRVVKSARSRGISFVELQTNAVLIDAAYASALAQAGLTSAFVSLLSDDPDLHDRLAGLSGAWPRCLAGIDALLDVGVKVTLNPVVANDTQDRLLEYLEFVAARLPRVRSVSLSAVQPHGRAAQDPSLLPDYAVLGPWVREARRLATELGIELLNPYCGLPLCVGWEDGLDRSVEAVEAGEGGWLATPGIENEGDKRQGPACRTCVFRGRCGGAWFAYWEHRGGSGLVPPALLHGPWASPRGSYEQVVEWSEGGTLVFPEGPRASFRWVRARSLGRAAADRLLDAPVNGVALELRGSALSAANLGGLHRLLAARVGRPPQRQPAVWLGIRPVNRLEASRAVAVAAAMGIDALVLLVDDPLLWEPLAAALGRQSGVHVRVDRA